MEQGTGSLPQMACFKRDFLGRAEMAGVTERGVCNNYSPVLGVLLIKVAVLWGHIRDIPT